MTDEERQQSERQRDHIARASREANRPRAVRVIEPADRDTEIMERLGFTYYKDNQAIDWKALTASA
jgi:hypothetical protein